MMIESYDSANRTSKPEPAAERVLLLHGLGVGGWFMRVMARRMARAGFATEVWSYSSIHQQIERNGLRLADTLRQWDETSDAPRIHLVTHSLGGIVTRHALAQFRPQRLGRVVMLAPPHRGSNLATWFAPWLGRWIPPVRQLTEAADSFVNALPPCTGVEVGIIAASFDILVPLANTHLEGETDHIVVPGWHGGLAFQNEPTRQTIHFLRHGKFSRHPAPAADPVKQPGNQAQVSLRGAVDRQS